MDCCLTTSIKLLLRLSLNPSVHPPVGSPPIMFTGTSMDRKSFVKGMLAGTGIGAVILLIIVLVVGCNVKPKESGGQVQTTPHSLVTTTPVYKGRERVVKQPKKVLASLSVGDIPFDITWNDLVGTRWTHSGDTISGFSYWSNYPLTNPTSNGSSIQLITGKKAYTDNNPTSSNGDGLCINRLKSSSSPYYLERWFTSYISNSRNSYADFKSFKGGASSWDGPFSLTYDNGGIYTYSPYVKDFTFTSTDYTVQYNSTSNTKVMTAYDFARWAVGTGFLTDYTPPATGVDLTVNTFNSTFSGTVTEIDVGGSTTLTFSPNAGYTFSGVTPSAVNCTATPYLGANYAELEVDNIQDGATVTYVPVEIPSYWTDVVFNGSHFTVGGSSTHVPVGGSGQYHVTPSEGYYINSASQITASNCDISVVVNSGYATVSMTNAVQGATISVNAYPYQDIELQYVNCEFDASDAYTGLMAGETVSILYTADAGYEFTQNCLRYEGCTAEITTWDKSYVWVSVTAGNTEDAVVIVTASPKYHITMDVVGATYTGTPNGAAGNRVTLVFSPSQGYTLKGVIPTITNLLIEQMRYDDNVGSLTIEVTMRDVNGSISVHAKESSIVTLYFPEDWSPLYLISNDILKGGGYARYDMGEDTGAMAVGPFVDLDGIRFSYNGVEYNHILFGFLDCEYAQGYFNADGKYCAPPAEARRYHTVCLQSVVFYYEEEVEGVPTVTRRVQVIQCEYSNRLWDGQYADTILVPTGNYYWLGNERRIFIFEDYGTTGDRVNGIFADYTDFQLLEYICEYVSPSQASGDGGWLGSAYDPFILLSTAINTASGMLGWTILPGLTLGVFFVIPLLITLIIVVFKIIKK